MGRSRSRSLDRYRTGDRDYNRGRGRSDSRERSRGRSRQRDDDRRKTAERSRSRGRRDHHHHNDARRDDDQSRSSRRDRSREPSSREHRHHHHSRKEASGGSDRHHRGEGRGGGKEEEKEGSRGRGDAASNGVDKATGEHHHRRHEDDRTTTKDTRREKKEEEEEGEDLDEASLLMMAGLTGEEEEERLIAERKRKRQQVLEQHQRKQEQEERELAGFVSGKSAAEVEEDEVEDRKRRKAGQRDDDDDDDVSSSSAHKHNGGGSSKVVTGDDKKGEVAPGSDDEDEDEETAVLVTTERKILSDEEEEEEEERERGTGGNEEEGETGPALDMFSFSPSKDVMVKPGRGIMEAAAAAALKNVGGREADGLEDNWDDHEGYYKTMVGELLADRYVVLGAIGRGVFSTVLKCQDNKAPPSSSGTMVAIKMVRNNDIMRKAAQKELELLREIAAGDPDNKKHCVRLLGHFEHRNHVALVFESLQMNLRETLRKFGKHVGINITAVRTYAKQLLVALKHIGNLGVVHADIKPDNILVNDGFSQLKLCDFGSAFREDAVDNDPTPYLVSRFYRAPEIILGFDYSRAVDLWSIGCCLYELFTGRVTFPGANNNEMLRLMMEMKGPLPLKTIRRHRQAYEKFLLEPMFEDDGRFRQREHDPVTKKPLMRLVHVTKPSRDLTSILMKAKAVSDDRTMVANLANLLEKIFTLDPAKRITVKEALHHPFVSASAANGHQKD